MFVNDKEEDKGINFSHCEVIPIAVIDSRIYLNVLYYNYNK